MTPYTFFAPYSPELLTRANRAHLIRSFGWRGRIALVVLLALFGIEIVVGERSVWVGALAAVLAFFALFVLAVYRTVVTRSVKRLEGMRRKGVDFVLTEQSLSASSDLGSGEVPWTQFEKVCRYPEFWLIYFGGGSLLILPVNEANEEARAYIVQKLQGVGAKIG